MQVQVSHDELGRALKLASKTASRRPTLPVLAGAKLEAFDSQLSISTTDLDITCRTILDPVKFSETGVVVVPVSELAAAVKGRQPQGTTVALTSDQGNGELQVTMRGMTARIRLLDAEDYPTLDLEHRTGDLLVSAETATLRAWCERVLPATSTNEARPVLTAVNIERHGVELTAAATDSYRLHTYTTRELGAPAGACDVDFLAPTRALRLAIDAMKTHKLRPTDPVQVWWSPRESARGDVVFVLGPTRLAAVAVEGEFPPWRELMPDTTGGAILAITDAAALHPVLDLATTQARRHGNEPIRLERGPDGSVLGIMRTQDVSTIELPLTGLKVSGETALDPIAFNAGFLRDMVTATGEGTVHFHPEGLKPATFENGNGFRGLLVPVRIP